MRYAEIDNSSNTIIRELDLYSSPPEHKFGLNKPTRIIPIVEGERPNHNIDEEFLISGDKIVFEDRVEKSWQIKKIEPPFEVPLWAFRSILTIMGYAEQVDSLISALPEPQKTIANVQWQYGNFIERSHPLIQTLGAELGLTTENIDNIFKEASKLK